MRSRLAFALAALCAATAAQADWKKDYDRGVKAAESGNWAEAGSAMRAALAEDADPSARKRFQGVVYKVYVPHHYAGLAAYRQGDCASAMQFWNNAANASVVSGIAALDSVQDKGVADCTAKLAGASSTSPASTASTGTTSTSPGTRPGSTSPGTAPGTRPGSTTPGTTPGTAPGSSTASTTTPAGTRPASGTSSTAATNPASGTTPPGTRPTTPVTPVTTPAPSVGPAPAALVQSADAFAQGRYPAVIASDPNTFGDARAKAQGFLLRAAARYTQAQLAGNDAQLEQARTDVRAARAANASLSVDETLFSPKFRAFVTATR